MASFAVVSLRETNIKKKIPSNYIQNFQTFKKYYPTDMHFCYISNDMSLFPKFCKSEYIDSLDYKEGKDGIYKVHVLRLFGE